MLRFSKKELQRLICKASQRKVRCYFNRKKLKEYNFISTNGKIIEQRDRDI